MSNISSPSTAASQDSLGNVLGINGPSGGAIINGTPAGHPTQVPSRPTIGIATTGDGNAQLTWVASLYHTPTAYNIYANGTLAATVSPVAGMVQSASITGLTIGTAYSFTVAGVNAMGVGLLSQATGAVTIKSVTWGGLAIPNLIAFYDPDQESYSNNTVMTSIKDWSGCGNTASTAATAFPTYVTAGMNSVPSFSMNGSSAGVALPLTTAMLGSQWTMVAAAQMTTVGASDNRLLCNQASTTDPLGFSLDTYTGWRYLPVNGGTMSQTGTATAATPAVLSINCPTTQSTGQLRVNGASVGNVAAPLVNAETIYLGTLAGTSRWLTGYIGKVALFNRALTATERHAVEAVIGARYGVTMTQS